MLYQETVQLLSMIQVYYPNQIKERNEELNELNLTIWHTLLEDLPFGEVKAALFIYMDSGGQYAPQVSDLKKIIAKMRNPKAFKSGEVAWEEVCYLANKFGFDNYEQAKEKFCNKTKRVMKVVKWWDVCRSEYPETVKKKFISLWNNITETEDETKKLSLWQSHNGRISTSPKEASIDDRIEAEKKADRERLQQLYDEAQQRKENNNGLSEM